MKWKWLEPAAIICVAATLLAACASKWSEDCPEDCRDGSCGFYFTCSSPDTQDN
ncbi:MAG: hypothetical protein AB7L92_02005 [Alphaproteobacteria bacterium]